MYYFSVTNQISKCILLCTDSQMYLLLLKLNMLFANTQIMLENMTIRFYSNLLSSRSSSTTVIKAKRLTKYEDISKFMYIFQINFLIFNERQKWYETFWTPLN